MIGDGVMAFQFSCPCGALLQAESWQSGQQCQCPYCGAVLVVPQDPSLAAGGTGQPFTGQPGIAPAPQGWAGSQFGPAAGGAFPAPAEEEAPRQGTGEGFPDVRRRGAGKRQAFDPTGEIAQEPLLHIPCPNGHVLESTLDMIGQEVLCPHCNARYTLKRKNSLEHQREVEMEQARKDAKAGKAWFTWAVIIAAAVLVGLVVAMIAGTWD